MCASGNDAVGEKNCASVNKYNFTFSLKGVV